MGYVLPADNISSHLRLITEWLYLIMRLFWGKKFAYFNISEMHCIEFVSNKKPVIYMK